MRYHAGDLCNAKSDIFFTQSRDKIRKKSENAERDGDARKVRYYIEFDRPLTPDAIVKPARWQRPNSKIDVPADARIEG